MAGQDQYPGWHQRWSARRIGTGLDCGHGSSPRCLDRAMEVSPKGCRNVLAPDESYKVFIQKIVRPARDILHEQGLKGFHELRAAYACERYEQLTGVNAPLVAVVITEKIESLISMSVSRSVTS